MVVNRLNEEGIRYRMNMNMKITNNIAADRKPDVPGVNITPDSQPVAQGTTFVYQGQVITENGKLIKRVLEAQNLKSEESIHQTKKE